LSGHIALSTSAAAVFHESLITGITAMTADDHTVIVAGTDHGRVVKVNLPITHLYVFYQGWQNRVLIIALRN